MQVVFGAGTCIGKRVDIANLPTIFFGVTQDWSLDIDQKLVTLLGQYKDPVDVAPGERVVTGKIKFARIQASGMGNLLFGVNPVGNAGFDIVGPETRAASAGTTYTVSSGATYLQDLGVYYHNTAIALLPVTAAPTAGQYVAGAAGVGNYTIAAADATVVGGLDFFYQVSLANQFEIDVNTALMGTGPTIELDMSVPYTVAGVQKRLAFQIYAARISKIPLAFKNTGYLIPEVDFTCFTNAAGNLLRWSSTE